MQERLRLLKTQAGNFAKSENGDSFEHREGTGEVEEKSGRQRLKQEATSSFSSALFYKWLQAPADSCGTQPTTRGTLTWVTSRSSKPTREQLEKSGVVAEGDAWGHR